MTSKFTRIVLPLLAVAVSAAAQTNAWELGHPDAKLLIGIDLKSLRESAVGQLFRSQMGTQSPQLGPAAMAFGFLEQIDRIFISSPAISSPAISSPAISSRPRKAGSTMASTKDNPPFLLVVEGTMPIQQLLAFLPGTARRYHMVDVYRGAKATDASIATLDARTILIGDEKSVLPAIDRRGHGAPPASAILARAQQLASTQDVWILATDDLSKFQPANTNFSSPLAGQVKGVDMGIAVRDGFRFDMSLDTASEAVAAQLTQLLSTQIALAQAQSPETLEAARKLHIETEGNRLRVSLALTKEEFEQNLRTVQAARLSAGGASVQPAAQPQRKTAQGPPAAPGKIRIYGLDEGVREIQMTH